MNNADCLYMRTASEEHAPSIFNNVSLEDGCLYRNACGGGRKRVMEDSI
jgi:hypothetical protein